MNGPVGPSAEDVGNMKRLIELMNGGGDSYYEEPAPRTAAPARAPSVSGNSDASDMKRILESFYGAAGSAVQDVIETSAHDRDLREAMITTRTPQGVAIGAWEVRARLTESTTGPQRKIYDVLQAGSTEKLFDGLVIFEAAHAIVRYLNKGLGTTHPKITEIADLEETYRRNRQDAVIFKKRYERCLELKEMAAGEVFEARYHKARAQAIVANDSIKTILENIR
jgi:hypothetical protein